MVLAMNRLMLAFAILAMLASVGCAQWANEPCVYCGGGPGPNDGGNR
jgi:hypothetical protein